jgi:peptidoglycan/LPS O-acetylase OafA/YrhL
VSHFSYFNPLSVNSIWPFLLCLTAVFLVADTRFFRAADTPPSPAPRRVKTIDGLRGFLALSVCLHHALQYPEYLRTGQFEPPTNVFYENIGAVGVGLFFMITGYLFWSRLLRDNGRADWVKFYIGRIFRIGPLFLFAFAALTLYVLVATHFQLRVGIGALLRSLSKGLTLGFLPVPDINGYPDTTLVLEDVTWTLHWEWLFYFALLFIGWMTHHRKTAFACVAGLLLIQQLVPFIASPQSHLYQAIVGFSHAAPHPTSWLLHRLDDKMAFLGMISMFLFGMLTAALHKFNIFPRVPDAVNSLIALVAIFAASTCVMEYGPVFHLLLGIAFYFIASGSTLFGLLTSRPARRLGDISYGIYLLQGLPHALVFRGLRGYALSSTAAVWVLTLISSILLIALATFTHVFVERPGIEAGKRFADAIRGRSSRQPS